MMKLPKRERERLHYLAPGPNRAKERSRTFHGIAYAMAEQWNNSETGKKTTIADPIDSKALFVVASTT